MGKCEVLPLDKCRQRNDNSGGTSDCGGGFTCNMTTHIYEGEIGKPT